MDRLTKILVAILAAHHTDSYLGAVHCYGRWLERRKRSVHGFHAEAQS